MDEPSLDDVVGRLRGRVAAWAEAPILERARLLERAMADTAAVADRWTVAALDAEGLPGSALVAAGAPLAGEAALVGPYLCLRQLRILRDTLLEVAKSGVPRLPGPIRRVQGDSKDGRSGSEQLAAPVFPRDLADRVLFPGVSAEVWMEPGIDEAALATTMAGFLRRPSPKGVVLVLGGGNVSSIALLDALTKLFVDGFVVLVKVHPVLDRLRPIWEEALAGFVEAGYLALVSGGGEVGAALCAHPGIDAVHLTGSEATHDAIVYGAGAEGAARKARDERILTKPMTAELGNVSPVLVVPGRWSDADLRYQAENLVTQLTNNAGFNCNAARVVVTSAAWPQRARFLDEVRRLLARIPPRPAYYPGADGRIEAFLAAHPEAERLGGIGTDAGAAGADPTTTRPWLFVSGLDPERPNEACFDVEAFCGAFAEVPLPGDTAAGDTAGSGADPSAFLRQATDFCNERLYGTLNATVIVDPATQRSAAGRSAIESAIADLRYGTVAINHWAAVGFALGNTTWGAYPGSLADAIGSGVGVVHNGFLFEGAQKSVLRAPFRAWPRPPWFATHRTAGPLVRHLVRFEAHRSLKELAAVGWYGLRG